MHKDVLYGGLSRGWVLVAAAALALALLPAMPAAAQTADRTDLDHACPEGRVEPSGFTDIAGNTHEHAIECLAWWDITRGGPAGRPASQYGPELDVYRDQMASFIARMIDESEGAALPAWDGRNRFTDVPATNVHVANINRLAEAGVVLGRTRTEYAPRMPVRRDQMASFIARAIHHVTGEDRASQASYFVDVPPTNPHRENINGLFEEGVVRGRSPGMYAPDHSVRRDAMAAFVMRAMDLHVEEGFARPPDARDDETPTPTPDPTPPATPPATPDPTGNPEPSTTTQNVTAAPELLSVQAVTLTGTTASVRFTFDHGIVADSVNHTRFLLYGIDTDNERYQATSDISRPTATTVLATFARDHYDNATSAGVAFAAVADLSGRSNPERTLGLQNRSFPAGRTQAPDLLSVDGFTAAGGNTVASFHFDRIVETAATTGNLFGLVLADGSEVPGNATAASPNSTVVQVRFDNQAPATLSANARRAVTRATAVRAGGLANPLRAVAVAGGGTTAVPDLVGVTLDRNAHKVIYEFNQPVADAGPNAPTERANRFVVFYVDGTQRVGTQGSQIAPTPPTVSSDGRRVTVQFASGALNFFVVGASVLDGAVRSLEGFNAVDMRSVPAVFVQGEVLGPRLASATAEEVFPTRYRVTWTFDRPIAVSSDGAFAVYLTNGQRLTTTPSPNGQIQNCLPPSGNARTCDVQTPPNTALGLAAVAYDAVENSTNQTGGAGTVFPNYEQARAF